MLSVLGGFNQFSASKPLAAGKLGLSISAPAGARGVERSTSGANAVMERDAADGGEGTEVEETSAAGAGAGAKSRGAGTTGFAGANAVMERDAADGGEETEVEETSAAGAGAGAKSRGAAAVDGNGNSTSWSFPADTEGMGANGGNEASVGREAAGGGNGNGSAMGEETAEVGPNGGNEAPVGREAAGGGNGNGSAMGEETAEVGSNGGNEAPIGGAADGGGNGSGTGEEAADGRSSDAVSGNIAGIGLEAGVVGAEAAGDALFVSPAGGDCGNETGGASGMGDGGCVLGGGAVKGSGVHPPGRVVDGDGRGDVGIAVGVAPVADAGCSGAAALRSLEGSPPFRSVSREASELPRVTTRRGAVLGAPSARSGGRVDRSSAGSTLRSMGLSGNWVSWAWSHSIQGICFSPKF